MSTSKNYDQGKKNEKNSWSVMSKKGFVKPTSEQKRNIEFALESVGKPIKTRGYDLIHIDVVPLIKDKNLARLHVDKIVLYELKTAGVKRETPLKEDFANFGFTYSGNEECNYHMLGSEQYKFIFLNLATEEARLLDESDWKPYARLYPTTSVFVDKPISGQTL
jgi:hypothetical protein